MNTFYKTICFASIFMFPFLCQAAFSSKSIKIDDIYYHIDDESYTAEVCAANPEKYNQQIITIPETIDYQLYTYTVTNIGYGAFDGATTRLIYIPSTISIIGDLAFYNTTNLEKCILPSSITKYGASMFSLSAIQTVALDSPTALSENMFADCHKLKNIVCNSEIPPLLSYLDNPNVFYGVPDDCIIYVPATAINTYKNIMGDSTTNPKYRCWGNFAIEDIAMSNINDNISDNRKYIYANHGYIVAKGYTSYTVYNIYGAKITSFPLVHGQYIVVGNNGDTYKIVMN